MISRSCAQHKLLCVALILEMCQWSVKLRLFIWFKHCGFVTELPVMFLAKHHFARLRETQQDPTMHVNICWQYLLVLFAKKSTCDWGVDDVVLRMVCCCCWFLMQWWLLWLPALLLLDRVLACLPFFSLISYWWLAFSSWSGTAPPCLDLQLLWFNPWSMWDGVLVCIGAVCKNSDVLVFIQCWSSELLLLVLLIWSTASLASSCGAASTTFSCSD
jgi:hypothetical protein